MKIKFKAFQVKHNTATRRCVADGHHGHYGSTTCSNCGADAENEYYRCAKCKSYFTETTYGY